VSCVRAGTRYGSGRVCKAALTGAIPPFLLKRDDNPEGVDGQVFEDMKATILKDRNAYFKEFLDNRYNVDALGLDRISEQAWRRLSDPVEGHRRPAGRLTSRARTTAPGRNAGRRHGRPYCPRT
jgi:hypothetical protein